MAEDEYSRLRWLCRRGMKELDLIMTRYLDTQFSKASETEKESFRDLLALPDPELLSLLLGRKPASSSRIQSLVQIIRKIARQA